jgi:hypothetical protein
VTQPAIKELEPPTVAPSSAFTDFVLKQISCAKLHAELTVNQCDMAITALSGGLIPPEVALLVLAECGLEIGEG